MKEYDDELKFGSQTKLFENETTIKTKSSTLQTLATQR
jgi:hypothetical protein